MTENSTESSTPVQDVVMRASRAVGFCFHHNSGLIVGLLGMIYEDGSSQIVASHMSTSEEWSERDIGEKPDLKESGLQMEWLGLVSPDDPRTACFRHA